MQAAKITLLIALASLGGLFSFTGTRLWTDANRKTSTIFETAGKDEGEAGTCGNVNLVDEPFLLQRTGAAVIFLFGTCTVFWSAISILSKDRPDTAT